MELHELESAWKTLDQRVAAQALDIERLREATIGGRLHRTLRRMTVGQVVQLAIGIVFAVMGGSYWTDHIDVPHLVAYGLGLHLYGILLLGSAVALLVRLAAVDYAKPVAEVQSQLLLLRRARIRTERILWIAGAIAWVPLMMMAVRAGLRLDVWAINPAYVLWNLAAGVAIAVAFALGMWLRPAWFARMAMDGPMREVEQQLAEIDALRA